MSSSARAVRVGRPPGNFLLTKWISCSFSGALPTLAGGLRGVEFAYRTLGERGVPGPWLYQWEHPDALPMQVRVRIADAQGAWPDLVVSLPLAASYGVAPEDAP